MADKNTSSLRKQLLAGGYWPIPNEFKACYTKDWNKKSFFTRESKRYGDLDKAIDSWDSRFADATTTGIRLQDGLCAIDGDIDDRELADALWDIVGKIAPKIADLAPARFGGGEHKVAWFARHTGEAPFIRHGSRKYVRPDAAALYRANVAAAIKAAQGSGISPDPVAKPPYHHLEIYGGAPTPEGHASKQFGCFGPHSKGRDYKWMDNYSLLAVPLKELPTLTTAQAHAIIDAFDKAAVELGWEEITEADEGDGSGADIFDISRKTTKFEVRGHGLVGYQELESLVLAGDDHIVLTANFIKGELSSTPDRCKARWSPRFGCVVVKDWKTSNRHYPNDVKAGADLRAVAGVMEKLKRQANGGPKPSEGAKAEKPEEKEAPPEPDYGAAFEDKVGWLIETRGYFETEDSVVNLHATSLDCRSKVGAFKERFRAWFQTHISNGKEVKVFATEIWSLMPTRQQLAGVRMTPDRSFPTYSENGKLFKNTYRRPRHTATGGNVQPFLDFMARFVPDSVEREWLYDWMAHKQARPEIPGQCVLFVADDAESIQSGVFGVGRGLLFDIVRRLYGGDYTRAQSFSMMESVSGQASFNDWLHGSVLVTVDESKSSSTAHRRGERSATYEVLKNLVDPAPKPHRFNGKFRSPFDGVSYCSFWIATNHADAIAIPAHDRRFTVVRNGRKMLPAEITAIVAWREDPANIAALSHWLASRDLSAFNAFTPLETTAKAEMAEMALSEVDEVLIDLEADETRGKVFIKKHFDAVVSLHFDTRDNYWMGNLKGAWNRYCVSVRDPEGRPRRVRVGGVQTKLYCFRSNLKAALSMPEAARRREAAKWGHIDGERDPLSGLTGGRGSHSGSHEKD